MTGLARQTIILTLAAMMAVALLAFSSKVWGQPAEDAIDEDSGNAPYAAGELIITYKPEAPGESVNGVGQRFEARVEDTVPEIDARLLSFPEVKSEQSRDTREEGLAQIKQTLEENPAVESVDYNYVRRPTSIPDDPRFDAQYGLQRIKAPAAWNKTRASGEVDIAVVDTGIDSDHPDLRSKIETQITILNGARTEGTAEDDTGHGTHVAGIAAAVTDNGKGVAGACPGCDLLIAKTFANDDGYD
ncbi:MAG: S8 family serine peptidase, partial [Rubrobacteraceae bacterium]